MRWEAPHGGDHLSPFWHATFPSERAARRAAERAVLTRGLFEPWAEGSTMDELEAALREVPESKRAPWQHRDGPDARSFKLVVEGWGAKMPEAARRAATQRCLAAAGLRARVDLAAPDDVFWLIVAPGNVEQGWTAADVGEEQEGGRRAAPAAAADAPAVSGGGNAAKPAAQRHCAKAGEQWFLDMFCRPSSVEGQQCGNGSTASTSPPHPNFNTLPYRAPTRLYFCRLVGACDRTAAVTRYNLNERPYIGPTSMDPEMAAVMANAARCRGGQLALDPFCGTGSILVALAAAGARVVGADIDVRVLRDGHAADGNAAAALARRRPKNAPKKRTAKRMALKAAAERAAAAAGGASASSSPPPPTEAESKQPVASDVLSNFAYYGLTPRLVDLVRLDAHRPLLRPSLPACFDAVVADPPYGVRAGGRKSERVPGRAVADRATHVPQTFGYSLTECLEDLLDLSARLLRPGGRLVFFMPAVVPGGAAAEAAKAAVRAARAREAEAAGGSSAAGGRAEGGGAAAEAGKAAGRAARARDEAEAAAGGGDDSSAGGRPEGAGAASCSSDEDEDDDEDDDDEDDDDEECLLGRETPTHPCLAHVATCEQVLSSRYSRRLVVMQRTARPHCALEAARHRAATRARLAALSDGLLAAVRLPRAPRVTRRERRAMKAAMVAGEGASNRGKHV